MTGKYGKIWREREQRRARRKEKRKVSEGGGRKYLQKMDSERRECKEEEKM